MKANSKSVVSLLNETTVVTRQSVKQNCDIFAAYKIEIRKLLWGLGCRI